MINVSLIIRTSNYTKPMRLELSARICLTAELVVNQHKPIHTNRIFTEEHLCMWLNNLFAIKKKLRFVC